MTAADPPMSVQEPDYPTEYRGNMIYDEKRVRELQPSERPDLRLIDSPRAIDEILDRNGIEHNRESIVLEDEYNCLWVGNGEIWGIHKTVPYLDRIAVRLK